MLGEFGIRQFIIALEECEHRLRTARKILIISPYYTHSAGNNILISLARRQIEINVLLQKKAWQDGGYSVDQALLTRLNNVGNNVNVRLLDDLHAKIFCIRYDDNSIGIWTGSANFTKKADGTIRRQNNPPNVELIQNSQVGPIHAPLMNQIRACWQAGADI